jgi:hypothetical protein
MRSPKNESVLNKVIEETFVDQTPIISGKVHLPQAHLQIIPERAEV